MSTISFEIIAALAFFLLIFVTGVWLSRSGNPYSPVAFNAHKLIALGAFVFLAVRTYPMFRLEPLGPAQMAAIAITALCFVVTIISGGLLNIGKPLPAIIATLHKLFPYLTVLSTAGTLLMLPFAPR